MDSGRFELRFDSGVIRLNIVLVNTKRTSVSLAHDVSGEISK